MTLPILPVLAETLGAGPCGDLAFIANKNGRPFTKESFGNAFKDACRAAGVPGSAHGLRKIAATRAANAGATVAQLEALSGAVGGRFAGDIVLPLLGRDLCVEVKARADGFRELYSWLDQRDVLVVKADRQEPLVVVRLSLATEFAKLVA